MRKTPPGARPVDVTSMREVLAATRRAFRTASVRAGTMSHRYLATLAARKGRRLVIGFALETGGGLARARRKLARKNADYIVLNDASALGAERASVTILGRDGSRRELAGCSKAAIARALLRLRRPE